MIRIANDATGLSGRPIEDALVDAGLDLNDLQRGDLAASRISCGRLTS